jgi:hypothetical protein
MAIAGLLRINTLRGRRLLMKRKTFLRPTVLLTLMIFGNSVHLVAQPDSIYRLPAGTRLRLKMDLELSSRFASVNDTFLASLAKPVIVNETLVLPVGSTIEGRVTTARPAGFGKNGSLDAVFEEIKLGYGTRQIDGVFVEKIAASNSFCLLSFLEWTSLKRGNEARIRKGDEFEIELRKEVVLPTIAY